MRLPAEYKLIEWIQDENNKKKPIPQNHIPKTNTPFHAIGDLQASPLHYWIVYRQHEPIPQCLLYHQTLYMSGYRQAYDTQYIGKDKVIPVSYEEARDVNGLFTLSEWIKYRPSEEIPDELCTFTLFLNSGLCNEIFTLWHESRPNEPIPIKFFEHHQQEQPRKTHQDKIKLIADCIIYNRMIPIPDELIFNGW